MTLGIESQHTLKTRSQELYLSSTGVTMLSSGHTLGLSTSQEKKREQSETFSEVYIVQISTAQSRKVEDDLISLLQD